MAELRWRGDGIVRHPFASALQCSAGVLRNPDKFARPRPTGSGLWAGDAVRLERPSIPHAASRLSRPAERVEDPRVRGCLYVGCTRKRRSRGIDELVPGLSPQAYSGQGRRERKLRVLFGVLVLSGLWLVVLGSASLESLSVSASANAHRTSGG